MGFAHVYDEDGVWWPLIEKFVYIMILWDHRNRCFML